MSAHTASIAALVQQVPVLPPEAHTSQVVDLLKGKSPLCAAIIATEGLPLGLVMNYHLNRELSTEFGRALFLRRAVTHVMTPHPLVVAHQSEVREVAERAMARPDAQLYDDVIVTQEELLLGTVSIQRLMGALAQREGILQIAGGVAHELNQPLQVVMGYSELLLESLSAEAPLSRAVQDVLDALQRMAAITRRLQTLTDVETTPYIGETRVVRLMDPAGLPETEEPLAAGAIKGQPLNT